MISAVFWTAVAAAGVVAGFVFAVAAPVFIGIGIVAGILFLWLGLSRYIVWRSTHYVFTNRQVLYRKGVFSREERGIALAKISDVKSNQSLLERLLSCGTLTVESAGEHGQTQFEDIPNIQRVTVKLRELVEHDESIGLRIGKWSQQNAVGKTEDGRIRADAEREGQHDHDRESVVLE